MAWASWWNWHLASFNRSWHGHVGRTGILPVSIDHGMGILVELASCQFQ
ncbi:MAG: hypothetical protein F6K55_32835 [Moorea sp. SIO4A3]|nr:hypothetical protein [Moorena sp. SIO4A3]